MTLPSEKLKLEKLPLPSLPPPLKSILVGEGAEGEGFGERKLENSPSPKIEAIVSEQLLLP